MEEGSDKIETNMFSDIEIASMIIIVPFVFIITFAVSAVIYLFATGGIPSHRWFWGPIGLILMIVFFVGWVFLAIKLIKKHRKLKIYFMTIGISAITSFLILWIWAQIPPIKFG